MKSRKASTPAFGIGGDLQCAFAGLGDETERHAVAQRQVRMTRICLRRAPTQQDRRGNYERRERRAEHQLGQTPTAHSSP